MNFKEHLSEFKLLYIICTIALSLIVWVIWYEYAYPCVYGHYEQEWQTIYSTDSNGISTPIGGYWEDVFICDCRKKR